MCADVLDSYLGSIRIAITGMCWCCLGSLLDLGWVLLVSSG